MESVSKSLPRRQESAGNVMSQEISWCPLKYKIQLIHSKGALLMIWVILIHYIYWYNQLASGSKKTFSSSEGNNYSLYLQLILQILTPLFGWIADAWIGRYKVILYSMLVSLLGSIMLSVEIIVSNYPSLNEVAVILFYISNFVNSLAITAFAANALPFITDQMIGASGAELSAAVDWYYCIVNIPFVIVVTIHYYINESTSDIVFVFLYSTGIALSLSSMFLCQHWLMTEPQITNPIKNVISVLKFAKKNKYLRKRSALTYWEETFPSRLDLGKDKYGGPFTEECVENVKTFLMLITLTFVISLGGLTIHVDSQYRHMNRNKCFFQSFLNDEDVIATLLVVFGIPFFHLILKPICFRHLHRISLPMLKIIGIGFVLYFTGSLGLSVIEFIGHRMNPNATCLFDEPVSVIPIDYDWALLLIILRGMGTEILTLTNIKFIIAQSPHQIKGLLYGCSYAFNGVAKLIGFNSYRPFKLLSHTTPSCGFYYYVTQSIILIFILILFVIVSKWYKLRTRNNPVNINLIIADHVEKYINQRNEHIQSQYSYGATDNDLIIKN